MFKFLKLRNSIFGDARRHVPFASIIHKPLSIFLSLVLVFILVTCPQDASAEALPIPPIWLPMNPYSSEGIRADFVVLNNDQKKIAKELIGAYGSVFFGLAAFPFQNPFETVSKVREWWYDTGDHIYETFIHNLDPNSAREVQYMIGSCIVKASDYETYQQYVDQTDPTSNNHSYIQVPPELTVAFKNWYAANGGVEDWQHSTKPFTSNVVYKDYLPGSLYSTYMSYINNMSEPLVRKNDSSNNISVFRWSGSFFSVYNNLFFNLSTLQFYLCDSNGNKLNTSYYPNQKYVYYYNGSNITYSNNSSIDSSLLSSKSFNPSNYNSYIDIVKDVYNNALPLVNSSTYFYLEDFVQHIYFGTSWSSKQEIFNIDDLNLGVPNSQYIDQTNDDAYTDINQLLQKIIDNQNSLEDAVKESTLVKDGTSAIPYEDAIVKALDKYLSTPASGITFDPLVFTPFFDDGKGFISYMWYMTKPLISYTRSLLDVLTFDPVDGFNASGPGYFILGVAGLGLIGGVIVKFLL